MNLLDEAAQILTRVKDHYLLPYEHRVSGKEIQEWLSRWLEQTQTKK